MFRQFPAQGPDGEAYIIIEFRDPAGDGEPRPHAAPRYELADGRHLIRQGQRFATAGGELVLSTA
ncbi:hypothetical protein HH299_17470 [Xanthomonas sp. Kuri4-2]